jgi:hypothetical protein
MICSTEALEILERSHRKDANEDSRLLELENEIFELKEEIEKFHPELSRLQEIWTDEMVRLSRAPLAGEIALSKEERHAAVQAIPECIEHNRLVLLQRPFIDRVHQLIDQMWSTPARTPEGKLAKLLVLPGYIMCDDNWREDNARADWDIRMARDLMIEFVGGEPAAQLREQSLSA